MTWLKFRIFLKDIKISWLYFKSMRLESKLVFLTTKMIDSLIIEESK